MSLIRVWTKQHAGILEQLEQSGRYIAKREYIMQEQAEDANIFLTVYDWYTRHASTIVQKPGDVQYPVWVSLSSESAMLVNEGAVLLELEIDAAQMVPVDLNKWGLILNYGYIPRDAVDKQKHLQLLKDYGTGDAQAYMTPFYPIIKQQIVESWKRLFDDTVIVNNNITKIGTIWEVRKEWVVRVIR